FRSRKFLIEIMQRRQHDLGCKRQRRRHSPGSKRAVVRSKGNAASLIIVKVHGFSLDAPRCRRWSIAGRDSPHVFAVSFEALWIADRIFLLRISCPAAVLEIINLLASHVFVFDASKVDPHMRKLVNEKRTCVNMLVT